MDAKSLAVAIAARRNAPKSAATTDTSDYSDLIEAIRAKKSGAPEVDEMSFLDEEDEGLGLDELGLDAELDEEDPANSRKQLIESILSKRI